MAKPEVPWFVRDRSEAMARLYLTARGGVQVGVLRHVTDGADLVVEPRTGDGLSTRALVVQVRGTQSTDPADWADDLSRLLRDEGNPGFLPVCAFVIEVRHDRGVWAWITEPVVRSDGPILYDHQHARPLPLDNAAAAGVVDQVAAWYAARAQQLQPA